MKRFYRKDGSWFDVTEGISGDKVLFDRNGYVASIDGYGSLHTRSGWQGQFNSGQPTDEEINQILGG